MRNIYRLGDMTNAERAQWVLSYPFISPGEIACDCCGLIIEHEALDRLQNAVHQLGATPVIRAATLCMAEHKRWIGLPNAFQEGRAFLIVPSVGARARTLQAFLAAGFHLQSLNPDAIIVVLPDDVDNRLQGSHLGP